MLSPAFGSETDNIAFPPVSGLARPGITVAMILAFIFNWNDFILGAVLTTRRAASCRLPSTTCCHSKR